MARITVAIATVTLCLPGSGLNWNVTLMYLLLCCEK
jgi:hypothetical protein